MKRVKLDDVNSLPTDIAARLRAVDAVFLETEYFDSVPAHPVVRTHLAEYGDRCGSSTFAAAKLAKKK